MSAVIWDVERRRYVDAKDKTGLRWDAEQHRWTVYPVPVEPDPIPDIAGAAPLTPTPVDWDYSNHTFIAALSGSSAVTSFNTRTGAVVPVSGDYYGVVATPKTGATAASEYAGATASGAPVSGTFALGDFIITQNGHVFVCTVAGTPGTWVDAGSVGNLVTSVFSRVGAVVAANGDYAGIVAAFLTGATAATRYVGGTVSGAPVSGTFAVGDHVVAQNGHIFVCTAAGSPGTWVDAGAVGGAVSSVFSRTGAVTAQSGDYTAAQVTNAADKGTATQQTFLSIIQGISLGVTGLGGLLAACRFVGAVNGSAPASGTYAQGDAVVDVTGDMWVCTVAGTPGTWVQVGGSAGGQVLIADRIITGSAVASVSFLSIPGTFKGLYLVASILAATGSGSTLDLYFNNGTPNNVMDSLVQGETYSGNPALFAGLGFTGSGNPNAFVGLVGPSGAAAPSSLELWIPNYAGTVLGKAFNSVGFRYDNTATMYTVKGGGTWRSTGAVTQLDLQPGAGTIDVGSRFTLYGLN